MMEVWRARHPGRPTDGAARPVLCIPGNALVVLIGASGSGKSTWARRHFAPTQVVSSDQCRALVADNEADQGVNPQAFAVFHEIIRRRLELGRLTVADSTGLSPFARARLRTLAAPTAVPVHAVVFCLPLEVLDRNNRSRLRRVPAPVLERHARELEEVVRSGLLEGEGYGRVHYLRDPPAAEVQIVAPVLATSPAPDGDRPERIEGTSGPTMRPA